MSLRSDGPARLPDAPPGHEPVVLLFWRSLGPYHVARGRALAERLRPLGARVVLAQIAAREETRDWVLPDDLGDLQVVTLSSGPESVDRLPSQHDRLRSLLSEIRPAVLGVAGYDRREMRDAIAWGDRRGVRVVLMSETKWDDRPSRPWWRRRVLRHVVGRAGALLVSGTAATEYMVTLGVPRERIFRPYGVVDNDLFERAAGDGADRTDRAPHFIACARLIESRKNLSTLLRAYGEYRRRAGDGAWGLVICGDGPDRGVLEDLAARRSLAAVEFLGFQQVADLARRYAMASCLVHPARREAWGLVVNEAMAAGLPVLVSRRCGCAQDLVVEGGTGYTFDPDSPAELADRLLAVSRLSVEERARMGARGRERIRMWHPERFAEGLLRAAWAAREPRGTAGDD